MDNLYLVRLYGDLAKEGQSGDNTDMFLLETTWQVQMLLMGISYSVDEEDDAVEVYKIEKGKMELVWGFWGWHFSPKMEQGFEFIEDDNGEVSVKIVKFPS